jgi:hypothetical protein
MGCNRSGFYNRRCEMESILFPLWYKCMTMTKEKEEEEKVRKIKIGSVPF